MLKVNKIPYAYRSFSEFSLVCGYTYLLYWSQFGLSFEEALGNGWLKAVHER
jgi:hypothetical protein